MAEQQVNITDLDPTQLQEVKKQLDQLKQAQTKFRSCVDNVASLTSSSKGKEILIPLTSSLYVPGKLTDVDNVVVDVGTGYYVKKTKSEATAHYNSKSSFVTSNLETLQKTIERKQENVQSVVQVLQMKMQQVQAQAAQGQGQGQAA
ncbi:prefoldin, alpha subunit [Kwoniella heveanensis CBS 569]|uniref:Prefoldin, alpha subunit n=1 Tax=Kwoniella heveanensis BCC8398 TaxID=1296120 RepID=A0A1B9GPY3_9TREE|nr:prefoldin, alpha subunit [Kwoniella heveanensis BCC8398]OCF44248.1 prefoldin, alpha subunit [Kwoniella heveanensis CBS 569]